MDISSLTSYTDTIQSEASSTSALSDKMAKTDYTTSTSEELLDACKEFEAYLMEQVYKEMEKTVDVFKSEDSLSGSNDSLVDYFQSTALQKLTETSTETQGLGLAQTLYEQMKRTYGITDETDQADSEYTGEKVNQIASEIIGGTVTV